MTELSQLRNMTKPQLAQLWRDAKVPGDPPHLKHALLRGIAWHHQEKSVGGLDAETRRLLRAAVRHAPNPSQLKESESSTLRKTRRDPVRLRSGTTLVRTWRDRKHEVTVLDDGRGFRYRETDYASLSEIAREITGARWSGPRFFGLKKLKSPA